MPARITGTANPEVRAAANIAVSATPAARNRNCHSIPYRATDLSTSAAADGLFPAEKRNSIAPIVAFFAGGVNSYG
jgi:hypothetical protein